MQGEIVEAQFVKQGDYVESAGEYGLVKAVTVYSDFVDIDAIMSYGPRTITRRKTAWIAIARPA